MENAAPAEEIIVMNGRVRVRIMHLASFEQAPWHYHRELTENVFGLSGQVLVQFQAGRPECLLAPGARCRIVAGEVHRLLNPLETSASYLLVQGDGAYDFQLVTGVGQAG